MRGGALLLSIVVLLAPLTGLAGATQHDRDPTDPCTSSSPDVVVNKIVLGYPSGESVHACLAGPADGDVNKLVAIAHGLGWTVQDGWLDHMERLVEDAPGTAVVATNYRDNFGFPVQRGAEDLVHVTKLSQGLLGGVDETILLGVSMGGAVSGTAIHIAPSMNGGEGLFDRWVNAEGVANLFETYTEARAAGVAIPFASDVADGIERDAGGTPAEAPQAYAHRSPVMNTDAMARAGLEQAVLVHSVYDGLVPYNQARELATALAGAGIEVQMNTVLRGQADHTAGTTPTSHALEAEQDPNEQLLELAGHASEADGEHIVMRIALERTVEMLQGTHTQEAYEELVHDEGPGPAT